MEATSICRLLFVACVLSLLLTRPVESQNREHVTLNKKADGYRSIWYMNQPSNDEYVYKYSGGLGTYCAKHKPFAIYCEEASKTFFCYGGTTKDSNRKLLHMVSYFDHVTKTVPRPTILLDKKTSDAHDNPVISVDDAGHIWIFSTSHGTARPSYIHRSVRPYDIDHFELVSATRLEDGGARRPITNFSYMQAWHKPDVGFLNFFTRYGYPAKRTICFMSSPDGASWSRWQRIAAIDDGHYQISGIGKAKAGSMFNYHPKRKGLNWRTNLYYIETNDNGTTWQSVDGRRLSLPLTEVRNDALVRDYEAEGLNVYLKDVRFDEDDRPVLLYITSKGYESGPKNDPRTWTIARWNGEQWLISPITASDNNYDLGELWMMAADDWRVIGPTEQGPQPYNPGGEVAMWTSRDQGATWTKARQLTQNSIMNHTYVRRSLNAHPDFIAIWADGHGRQPSESRIHFADRVGNVFQLPVSMNSDDVSPVLLGKMGTPAEAARRHQRVVERRKGIHIICHRGAVEFAHENSLEAYRAAFELGADGNEIDIRATKDGVLVCFHDDMVDHLLEAYGDVADYDWGDLQRLPFRNPGRFGKYCRIPTLREAFELHRDYAGLLHLDVKRPRLVEPICALLDELDMWDHVVQAPTDFTDARIKMTRGKGGMYLDRTEVDATAIEAALKKPGERVILEYPQGVATVLGRKIAEPSDQPVKNVIAAWATRPTSSPLQDNRSVAELLQTLQEADDWNRVAHGPKAEAASADMILQRALVADELARRGAATPEVFEALEERVRNRSLHRSWRYCGLDGIAAFRALTVLKAPQTVDVARFCLWRDDPAVEAAQNPEFQNPRSWTDWRTKVNVFSLLESVPGPATEQLCRDYLALSDEEARVISTPQFEQAAKTLLTLRPSEATVNELLNHRLSVVRGRAVLFCLANDNEPWARRIAAGFLPSLSREERNQE